MLDAGRDRYRQALLVQLLAAAITRLARLAPYFAAAAATRAGARHADVERHHGAGAGLTGGKRDLGVRRLRRPFGLDMIAAEKLDCRARRGKINGHFVGKRPPIRSLMGHERFERNTRRVGSPGTKHLAATIEAVAEVVKNNACKQRVRMRTWRRKNARCAANSCAS